MYRFGGFEQAAKTLTGLTGTVVCPDCRGSGRLGGAVCTRCEGSRTVPRRRYTRQGVRQLWKYRDTPHMLFGREYAPSGFPELDDVEINGHAKKLFNLAHVIEWYETRFGGEEDRT